MSELQAVSNCESVDEYFECSCSWEAHTLHFSYHPWDSDKELYTHIHLTTYHGFFKRLWLAIKYVFSFGDPCPFGHWDCWNLRKEDAFRLRNLIDKYISEVGLVVENGIVKEPKKNGL
jgi:hypothetical protein